MVQPLRDFDANAIDDQESMLEVVTMIMNALGQEAKEARIIRAFNNTWEQFQEALKARLDAIEPQEQVEVPKPDIYDVLDEVLVTVRSLANQVAKLESESRTDPMYFNGSFPSVEDFTIRAGSMQALGNYLDTIKVFSPNARSYLRAKVKKLHRDEVVSYTQLDDWLLEFSALKLGLKEDHPARGDVELIAIADDLDDNDSTYEPDEVDPV